MDGVLFNKAKPPKDWDEAMSQTTNTFMKGLNDNLDFATKFVTEKGGKAKETIQSGEAMNKLKESGVSAS
jgi:hypothetical protein